MSLSNSTLSAIQKAGAAVFAADVKIKNEVKDYAERANAAIAANPYNPGNDPLFASWKVVARLAQTIAGLEEEIRKVYDAALELSEDEPASVVRAPKLSLPVAAPAAPIVAVEASVVVSKLPRKNAKAQAVAKPKAVAPKALLPEVKVIAKLSKPVKAAKVAVNAVKAIKAPKAAKATKAVKAPKAAKATKTLGAAGRQATLGGNPTKLLQYLEGVLNTSDFTEVNQSLVAQTTGIPLGSMTAATKKLIESGRLLQGGSGSFKLVAATPGLAI
jgi:hypothetical protein